ncbi:hypothetical protein E2C01_043924 [Portunus trituberculatus]|uniref:Uncharacterized protein n=1 Tax=Portunus trituberculatus TaxID=210409 RepID=A0A5B7FU73_PORTR|nr:hypothetical protein [Portunus trituberculatus]
MNCQKKRPTGIAVSIKDSKELLKYMRLTIGSKYNVQVEVMDVSIYAGELNCDDIRRRFAGKEIGILGKLKKKILCKL